MSAETEAGNHVEEESPAPATAAFARDAAGDAEKVAATRTALGAKIAQLKSKERREYFTNKLERVKKTGTVDEQIKELTTLSAKIDRQLNMKPATPENIGRAVKRSFAAYRSTRSVLLLQVYLIAAATMFTQPADQIAALSALGTIPGFGVWYGLSLLAVATGVLANTKESRVSLIVYSSVQAAAVLVHIAGLSMVAATNAAALTGDLGMLVVAALDVVVPVVGLINSSTIFKHWQMAHTIVVPTASSGHDAV